MATNAKWTVVMDDKMIIKNYDEGNDPASGYNGMSYVIDDNDFWGQAKFSNIWAIQYGTSVATDTVEYRDETPHSTWEDANLGDIQDFITRWDAAHLAQLQSDWDNDNLVDDEGASLESEADKIARLGARPTSYTSS
jgi:hypothetical protein|tara:strand:+ start:52 stop:462 length:411 start_codon:yes stop_codon:yes gene_type:complete